MLEKSTLQSVAMDTMLRSRRAALIRPERKQHLQVQSLRLANKLSARLAPAGRVNCVRRGAPFMVGLEKHPWMRVERKQHLNMGQ